MEDTGEEEEEEGEEARASGDVVTAEEEGCDEERGDDDASASARLGTADAAGEHGEPTPPGACVSREETGLLALQRALMKKVSEARATANAAAEEAGSSTHSFRSCISPLGSM